MGLSHAGFGRGSSSINILIAVLAGILIGLAGFLVKLALGGIVLDSNFIFSILLKPLAYLSGILGLAGFLLFQKALHRGKVSLITPIVTGMSIAVPVVLAFLFLSEIISTLKIIGIVLILVGVFGLRD